MVDGTLVVLGPLVEKGPKVVRGAPVVVGLALVEGLPVVVVDEDNRALNFSLKPGNMSPFGGHLKPLNLPFETGLWDGWAVVGWLVVEGLPAVAGGCVDEGATELVGGSDNGDGLLVEPPLGPAELELGAGLLVVVKLGRANLDSPFLWTWTWWWCLTGLLVVVAESLS